MELSRPVVVQHQGYLTLTLDFQGQILKMLYVGNGRANSWNEISGMGGPINMEWKGYESIGCYTYYVTLSYDMDLGFSRSNI